MSRSFIEATNIRYEIMMKIEQNVFKEIYFHSEFEKEYKKLLKKWSSLEEDLQTLINKPLKLCHKQNLKFKYLTYKRFGNHISQNIQSDTFCM